MTSGADGFDRFQRRHPAVGFPLGVVYKFFDDQGPYLATVITYYAFVAIFPLMLIASSILGFLLQGNPKLEHELLNSALSQFPIVGEQLGRPGGLQGSASAVVVGSLAALYGATGLGQAGQNAMNVVWAVPRNSRPNPFLSRVRSLILLSSAGLGLLTVAVLSSLANNVSFVGASGTVMHWLVTIASVVISAAVLAALFTMSTSTQLTFRQALPGAMFVAVGWQVLQMFGGLYVRHVVSRVSQMNAVFALVLGLIALIYVASQIAVLGAEVSVVRQRRLFPRALLTPFTDDVDLTPADRRVYRDYARAQRHKGFERIDVTFDKHAKDGEEATPAEQETRTAGST